MSSRCEDGHLQSCELGAGPGRRAPLTDFNPSPVVRDPAAGPLCRLTRHRHEAFIVRTSASLSSVWLYVVGDLWAKLSRDVTREWCETERKDST